jgi:hypothetical protein
MPEPPPRRSETAMLSLRQPLHLNRLR